MSFLDSVRQTLSDVSDNVVERSQQLSAQARLQLALKKLQLERAKRIHELGTRTFEWYQSGNLTVGGQVPPEVTGLCRQVAEVQHQLDETERQLEAAKQETEDGLHQAAAAPPTVVDPPGSAGPAPGGTPASPSPPPPPGPTPPGVAAATGRVPAASGLTGSITGSLIGSITGSGAAEAGWAGAAPPDGGTGAADEFGAPAAEEVPPRSGGAIPMPPAGSTRPGAGGDASGWV